MNNKSTQIKRGRKPIYTSDDPKAPMTIVLHESYKDRLKIHALKEHTTASAMIEAWIDEYCEV